MAMLESRPRQTPRGHSLKGVRDHVDAYLRGQPGHDDISFAVVAVPLEERKSLPVATMQSVQQGPVSEWRLELAWSAQELREIDIVPAVLGLTNQIRALKAHQGVLFLVLSKLYEQCPGSWPARSGFVREGHREEQSESYLALRAERLENRSTARSTSSCTCIWKTRSPCLTSPSPTAAKALTSTVISRGLAPGKCRQEPVRGRGIALVRQLSMDVAYSGAGNRVWARYKL